MHVLFPRFCCLVRFFFLGEVIPFFFPPCDALSLRFFDVNVEGIVLGTLSNTQPLSSPHHTATTTTASEYICVSFPKKCLETISF